MVTGFIVLCIADEKRGSSKYGCTKGAYNNGITIFYELGENSYDAQALVNY